ncbi:unnamed protein product, partial [Mesorhabditis spiculigera]
MRFFLLLVLVLIGAVAGCQQSPCPEEPLLLTCTPELPCPEGMDCLRLGDEETGACGFPVKSSRTKNL